MPTIIGDAFDELLKISGHKMEWDQSSPKMKATYTILGAIKKQLDKEETKEFNKVIEKSKNLIEQKRYYVSNYGIENYVDVVNGATEIKKSDSYDKFELGNIISWWKKKATKRYDKLKEQDRIRNDIEIWSNDCNIDIIR